MRRQLILAALMGVLMTSPVHVMAVGPAANTTGSTGPSAAQMQSETAETSAEEISAEETVSEETLTEESQTAENEGSDAQNTSSQRSAKEEEAIRTRKFSLVTLADSDILSVFSLRDKTLGTMALMDRNYSNPAVESLQKLDGDSIMVLDYYSIGQLMDALYAGQIDAALVSDTFHDMILEDFPEFEEETRTVYTFRFERDDEEFVSQRESKKVDVTSEPFILYFSGIDTYGTVKARSRSDVNIMAVANPLTHQILLVTTPRDYYVELPFAGNAMDKLTHSGIYGIDASIETLEQLYDLTINYYARVNFTGFMNIIDALGGVDVYSSRDFTGEVFHIHFNEGYNHVDGQAALSFVRERHSFADGDFQRQRNQMEMIKAVMHQMFSPSIMFTYPGLLQAVADSFTTDLNDTELKDLIRTLLSYKDWNIQTYGVTGEGVRRSTYSMGSRQLFVELQDEASLGRAKELIQMVFDGETLPEDTSIPEETTESAEETTESMEETSLTEATSESAETTAP